MVTEKELELLACLEKSSRLSVDRYISEAVKYRGRRSKEDGCEVRK